MAFSRIVRHALVLAYLAVLAFAMSHALFRTGGGPLGPIVEFAYGMVAPFQGYAGVNEGLQADGERADGAWEGIDLAPYFPVSDGERSMREERVYRNSPFHEPFAEKLLSLHPEYARVRLSWSQWTLDLDGHRANAHAPTQEEIFFVYP